MHAFIAVEDRKVRIIFYQQLETIWLNLSQHLGHQNHAETSSQSRNIFNSVVNSILRAGEKILLIISQFYIDLTSLTILNMFIHWTFVAFYWEMQLLQLHVSHTVGYGAVGCSWQLAPLQTACNDVAFNFCARLYVTPLPIIQRFNFLTVK